MSGGSQNIRFTIQAIDSFSPNFRNLERQLETATSKMEALGRAGAAVGKAVAAVGAAGAAGLGIAVSEAAKYEKAMASMNAMVTPTKKEFEQLGTLARELGRESTLGADTAAKAIEELGRAGVSTASIIDGGLKAALDLSVAGELAAADAAEMLSVALNGFRNDGLKAVDVANLLAGTANASATSVGELKYSLSMVGSVASGLGLTFEDTNAALGVLAQNALRGSDAGTSLKTMLSRLNPMTKKAREEMEELGIITKDGSNKFFDAKGNIQSMSSIAGTLQESLKGLTKEQKQATLYTLFGSDAIRAGIILSNEGAAGIDKMTEAMKKTTAAEVAAGKLEGLIGTLDKLKASGQSIAITFGEALLPPLTKAAEYLQGLADKFEALPESLQQNIALWIAIGSAIAIFAGGLLILAPGIAAAVKGFGALKLALAPLGAIFSPIGLAIAAIVIALAAIGYALYLAYQKCDWFREMVLSAWTQIKDYFFTALEFIKGVVTSVITEVSAFIGEQLAKITAFWAEHGDTIQAGIKKVMEFIGSNIQSTMDFLVGLFEVAWPIISGAVEIAWGIIKTAVETGLDLVLGIVETMMALLDGNWSQAWDSIKGTAEDIMDNIVGFFEDIDLVGIGEDIIAGLIKGIGSMAGAVERKVASLAALIPDGLKEFLGVKSPSRLIRDEVGKFIPLGLAVGIDGSIGAVKKSVKSMAAAAVPDMGAMNMPSAMPSMAGNSGYSNASVSAPKAGGVTNNFNPNLTVNLTVQGNADDPKGMIDFMETELAKRLNSQMRLSGFKR